MDKPLVLPIKKIYDDADRVKTFEFDYDFKALPGQFAMVWLPGVNEKPFSFSYPNAITVMRVGDFTEKLFKLKEGDLLGFRGPYGRPFSIVEGKSIAVGGGCGCAPMFLLCQRSPQIKLILGARSEQALIKSRKIKGSDIIKAIDPKFPTQILEEKLKKEKVEMVYSCGPEKMMVKVIEICEKYKVNCEVSLERYMKCGFGLCGQCCIDNSGWRVCKDGPVISGKEALKLSEFGKYRRESSGQKIKI